MTTVDASEGINRRGLRDDVYDRLLTLLMSSELMPGNRLSIDRLADRLGVSPTPVREALVQLERTGLVTRMALKGYRVAEPLSPRQMTELLEVREMIEMQAVRWAAQSPREMVRELQRAHRRHATATASLLKQIDGTHVDITKTRDYFVADEAFHHVIYRHAGNRFLEQLAADLASHQHRMRQSVLHHDYDVEQALSEHAAVLAAAEANNPDGIIAAMQAHMTGVRERSASHPSEGRRPLRTIRA